MSEIQRVETRDDLIALANRLGVRPDWHEPDEQEVTASVHGGSFDNAGYWGEREYAAWITKYGLKRADRSIEMWVTLYQDGHPVAEVNLASLFAFATGHES